MSLFKNLFGRRSQPTPPAIASGKTVDTPPGDPSKDPNMIRVFDAYGREMFITRQQWHDNVLMGNIQRHWNTPDQLAELIIGALNDGFFEDMVKPAERLAQIDPNVERSVVLLAIVYLKVKRLDDSERVLQQHIRKHGESGVVLNNLAKAYAEREDHEKSLETLWRGLQLDPNQDNGMGWYEVIHREKGGEEAGLEALRRIAAIPGSWRAQLWLARSALNTRQTDQAIDLYKECLSRVGQPVPADLLMQMSGDLGNSGRLPEILQLVEPCFNPTLHCLQVGNNLIKAHVDLGQLDAARRILDQLYALNRPDWKEQLSFWDTEIAKARVAMTGEHKDPVSVTLLAIEGPIWLKPSSPVAELFPKKSTNTPTVCFLGCSAEAAPDSKRIQLQLANAPGRMSRALPLFLAEQVGLGSQARVQTLVPWILGEAPGFVLGGVPWKDHEAANYAQQSQAKGDYVVISHLRPNAEPWIAELRLVRTLDAQCLGTLSTSFPSAKPEDGIPGLAQQLKVLLHKQAGIEQATVPSLYQVPDAPHLGYYLLRLEQLLTVRCAGMDGVPVGFLHGEREIMDGNLQLCLAFPQNVVTRILLAQTSLAMKRMRPDILPEFREKIELLQREKPLPEPVHGVVQRMLNEVVAA